MASRQSPPHQKRDTIRKLVTRIDLSLAMMVIRLEKTAPARALGYHASEANLAAGPSGESFDIECPIALRRRGKETRIVLADKSRRTA